MDADVVPGPVTDWTVTRADQRRLQRATMGLLLRSWAYWVRGLLLAAMASALWWFWTFDPHLGVGADAVSLLDAIFLGGFLLLVLASPLLSVRRRVTREYPVGATLSAWATETGLGVRTPARLTFYPWSRLTQVAVGRRLVRCRQAGPRNLTVAAYLPAGPDELARSVDFPAELIGPELRRVLVERTGGGVVEAPLAGAPIIVGRALRWRLVHAWLRAQFGFTAWLLPVVGALNTAFYSVNGSYRLAAFWVALMLLLPLIWLLAGEGRMSGMYPAGATVVGSVGEWIEVQGPWGSVAWHHTWLLLRRTTRHTMTYEVLGVGRDGRMAVQHSGEKRFVVIPRAFLDTPRMVDA